MAANPDPARITDALWAFWEKVDAAFPGMRLGGIYAPKPGYHNTVAANLANWPNDYSVELPLDLVGPRTKARAVDLTPASVRDMITITSRLKAAADHPDDIRLKGIREFIGTLDGRTVFCYIRDTDSGSWTFDGGRDTSHLWHEHMSWWTTYCADMAAAQATASVVTGVTWEEWSMTDVYYRVQSTDARWNGTVWVSNRIHRRSIRPPGEIRKAALLGATEFILTDAMRLGVSPTETWDAFLDAVAGPLAPTAVGGGTTAHTHTLPGTTGPAGGT